MTLNQWLTTTDPAAMLAAMGDQADERRKQLWAQECENRYRELGGEHLTRTEWWLDNILFAFSADSPTLAGEYACDFIRCLWPPPMIERERAECPECKNWSIRQKESITRQNCKTCNDTLFTLSPLIDPRYRTPLVMDLARRAKGGPIFCPQCEGSGETSGGYFSEDNMMVCDYPLCRDGVIGEKSPDPEVLPILADALMDAGFGNEVITGHLRAPHHVPGECWVIAAILN